MMQDNSSTKFTFWFLIFFVNTAALYLGAKCILTLKSSQKKEALTGIIPCQQFIFSAR